MRRAFSFDKLGTVVLIAFALATFATAAPPANHTANEQGHLHAVDHHFPYTYHCTDCHADDLLGGIGPSCYQCHVAYWYVEDVDNLAPHSLDQSRFLLSVMPV